MIGSEVEALSNLLKAHGDKVLSGGQRLALTAALVQKVSAAFSLLVTSAGGGNLRDFQVVPASSNTRLNDLHFLHDFLQRVDALLVSHGSSTLRGDVDLAKFRNLM
jgi:LKB1 serine/threonine kinase interacting protein 1